MAQKMALVPQELLTTIKKKEQETITPLVAKSSELNDDIQDILNTPNLPDFEKAKLYGGALRRYLAVYKQRIQPVPVKISIPKAESVPDVTGEVEEEGGAVAPTATVNPAAEEDILGSVPTNQKRKAAELIKKLNRHKDVISYNNKGELLHRGVVIPGSHIGDLFSQVLLARPRARDPKGFDNFMHGLAEINVPSAMLQNKRGRDVLDQYKTGTADGGDEGGDVTPRVFTRIRAPDAPVTKRSRPSRVLGSLSGVRRWLNY